MSIWEPELSQYPRTPVTSGRCSPGSRLFSSTNAMDDVLRLVSHEFPEESTGTTATHVIIEGARLLPSERYSMVTGNSEFLSTTITGSILVASANGTTSAKM